MTMMTSLFITVLLLLHSCMLLSAQWQNINENAVVQVSSPSDTANGTAPNDGSNAGDTGITSSDGTSVGSTDYSSGSNFDGTQTPSGTSSPVTESTSTPENANAASPGTESTNTPENTNASLPGTENTNPPSNVNSSTPGNGNTAINGDSIITPEDENATETGVIQTTESSDIFIVDETTPEEEPVTEPPEITTSQPAEATTAQHSVVHPKGVSEDCLDLYDKCTNAYHVDQNLPYCVSFKNGEDCIKADEGIHCTEAEKIRLETLDCGPATLFQTEANQTTVKIGDGCLDRITDCLSWTEGVESLSTIIALKQLFCDLVKTDASCLTAINSGKICTLDEYKNAVHICSFSSGKPLFSGSILLIAITFLVQKMLGKA